MANPNSRAGAEAGARTCRAQNVPLEQIITLAVAQSVGVWSNESYVAMRAKRGSREKFLEALKEVPDVEPPDHDRLPEGYRPAH